jgi:hypothetical protein
LHFGESSFPVGKVEYLEMFPMSFLEFMEASGLIIKAHIVNSGEIPFSAYTKDNYFKLFCFDVGLLGSISQLPPKAILDYDYGRYKGYFAENFVAQEFRCAGVDII